LSNKNLEFDHIPSNEKFKPELLQNSYKLFILSDYPVENFTDSALKLLAGKVKSGASLLMIGGWESFHGETGGYQGSLIEDLLPVFCMKEDDRENYYQGLVPVKVKDHPITDNLPFEFPPVICGYNRVIPKENAEVILYLKKLVIEYGAANLDAVDVPYMIAGKYGRGKTGAVTSDFAPHWVGGLVDWGNKRVKAQAVGGNEIEVGNYYVELIYQLVSWFL
jgi:uncharacterized membrane protein